MESSPSGGCQLGRGSSNLETWVDCTGAHGQDPMKSFEPRSMMQEHPHRPHLDQASQRVEEKEQLDSANNTFLNFFEKTVVPSFE